MKNFILFLIFIINNQLFAQQEKSSFTKGSFYFYWGYNRGFFSQSDIRFNGNGYDFKLNNVTAKDRPSKVGANPYLKIDQITIPQYNYRLGYCVNKHYNLSLGWDHMKYVMNKNQTVNINGYISNSNTIYDKQYSNEAIKLAPDFLQFEHTDGLNYINAEITRMDYLLSLHKNIELNSFVGAGIGGIFPRTRSVLLNKPVNDEWNLSGYGISAKSGINITFFKRIFLQAEIKAGFINMPNIATTSFKEDRAKQHFTFLETAVLLGYRFAIH